MADVNLTAVIITAIICVTIIILGFIGTKSKKENREDEQ